MIPIVVRRFGISLTSKEIVTVGFLALLAKLKNNHRLASDKWFDPACTLFEQPLGPIKAIKEFLKRGTKGGTFSLSLEVTKMDRGPNGRLTDWMPLLPL